MTMRSKSFTYPLVTSVLIHMAGLASAPHLIDLSDQSLPSELIAIEVLTAAPELPPPSSPPQKEIAKPRSPENITPPRIIERPQIKLAAPISTLPPIEEPLPSAPVQVPMEYPREAKQLLPGPPPYPETAPLAKPERGPLLPLPAINAEGHRGNVVGPTTPAQRNVAAPVAGGEAGTGSLYGKGDVAVVPGMGSGGGSGGAGRSGRGLGTTDNGAKVAGINPGFGGEGSGGGAGNPIRLARPRGDYQTRPRYPESARQQGIEGVSLLRFEVQANGTVGEIHIERSAGYQDLDRAAVEAVKKWRFDPARRGNQPMAVWVTLPVRFELR